MVLYLKQNGDYNMAISDVKLDKKIVVKITEPKNWKVIFLNDDQTPMEFVISVLMEIYKHSIERAKEITIEVHEAGKGVAGSYCYEIAEIKLVETINLARANGFPLQAKMEEEE